MSGNLPEPLVRAMASRAQRLHNYLWHEVRSNWHGYPSDTQETLRAAGWEPPRPATDAAGQPLLTNGSGEDYLYMHRQLLQFANRILAEANDPAHARIEGWVDLPAPHDQDYPVPAPWFDPLDHPIIARFIPRSKTDIAFYKNFRSWERLFKDVGFLAEVSIGELGSLIQFTLHDAVKRRWSAVPGGRRPDPGSTSAETIPVEWDDPRYDYLADTYSMQVNPIYWKFYGWVNDRVEEWKLVHGIFGEGFWQARWVGKMPETSGAPAPQALHAALADAQLSTEHADETERLIAVVAASGRTSPAFTPESLAERVQRHSVAPSRAMTRQTHGVRPKGETVPYTMRGQFLEVCDCSVPCPCWFVEDPDEDECTGVIAWQIEHGAIDGVDVTGLTVVSISQHAGSRGTAGAHPKMRVALIVDENATDEQATLVARAFSGQLGGPLGELAEMTESTPQIDRAMIEFHSSGSRTEISVGTPSRSRILSTAMTPIVGATGRITTVADSAMANLLGLGEVGKASGLTIDLPVHSLDLNVENRSATRGRFSYVVD
jgi:hypothetical protein